MMGTKNPAIVNSLLGRTGTCPGAIYHESIELRFQQLNERKRTLQEMIDEKTDLKYFIENALDDYRTLIAKYNELQTEYIELQNKHIKLQDNLIDTLKTVIVC